MNFRILESCARSLRRGGKLIFGCTVGKFSRRVRPSPKEFELLTIAVKG